VLPKLKKLGKNNAINIFMYDKQKFEIFKKFLHKEYDINYRLPHFDFLEELKEFFDVRCTATNK